MKRTICKQCNLNRETIIGVETHCSECGKELIHIINYTQEKCNSFRRFVYLILKILLIIGIISSIIIFLK